tara:strand:- start:127 stop:423 length:297 start_codon:yes stop_codon:yes gene_type:complete
MYTSEETKIKFDEIISEEYEFVTLFSAAQRSGARYNATLWMNNAKSYFISFGLTNTSHRGDVKVIDKNLTIEVALSILSELIQDHDCQVTNMTKAKLF